MEQLIVWTIVAAAALWFGSRFAFRRRRAGRPGECNHDCDSCAFAKQAGSCAPVPDAGARSDSGHRLTVVSAIALVAALPMAAGAADTTEAFDADTFNVELYLGSDGLGNRRAERAMLGDVLVGYGFADSFSGFVGSAIQTDGALGSGSTEFYLGFIGTPVDLEHFDLDLLLSMGFSGDDLRAWQLVPGLETNLDFESTNGSWGPFLRLEVPVSREPHFHPNGAKIHRTSHAFDLTPGLYLRVAERHELVVEYALARSTGDDACWEDGGAALGYNVLLSDMFELITQASMARADDRWVAGLLLGVIATLPGV